MIKGTRMIVITRKKIIAAGIFLLIAAFSIPFAVHRGRGAVTAFSAYKSIIDSELLPAAKKDGGDKKGEKSGGEAKDKTAENAVVEENEKDAEKAEGKKGVNTAEKEGQSDKILRRFFMPGKKQSPPPTPAPTPEATAQNVGEPALRSESVTVNKGLKVSNSTSYNVNPQDFLGQPLAFSLDNSGAEVLIMHTHTTESFSEETYIKGAPDRNLDETKNITAVGAAMAEVFRKNGIGVIHDKTVHDYPSYNGAYQKAAATINKNLAENKSIKVVLDVHRDGITRADGTKVKLVTEIDGQKTAQIMLVVGSNVNLVHDRWQENFKFASKIQAKAIEMYPSLMRPIDLRQERFNEQLTTGSLIVEVGSNGNTMEEAIRGATAAAEAICRVLKSE